MIKITNFNFKMYGNRIWALNHINLEDILNPAESRMPIFGCGVYMRISRLCGAIRVALAPSLSVWDAFIEGHGTNGVHRSSANLQHDVTPSLFNIKYYTYTAATALAGCRESACTQERD